MNPQPFYLEQIHNDWEHNLLGIQTCVEEAYAAARKKTDHKTDPDFKSPNQPFLEGNVRWGFVDTYLARGCENGLIKGVTAHWMPTGKGNGGIRSLELRAQHSAVSAHHLQFQQDAPRESDIRTDLRVLNQMNPLLPGFDATVQEEDQADADLFISQAARDKRLINLLLLHGSKLGEFAYLRLYNKKDDLSNYIQIFGNIMALPSIVQPSESEPVKDAELGLKNPKKDKLEGNNEG